MVRVHLYGPRPLLPRAAALLQDLGVMHIDRPPPETRWGFRPLQEEVSGTREAIETETLLERLKKILLLLPAPPPERFPADASLEEVDPSVPEFTAPLSEIIAEAEKIHLRLKAAREEKSLLQKYENVIRTLAPLMESVNSSPELEMVGITFDRDAGEILPLIRQALDQLTGGNFQLVSAELDEKTVAALLLFGRSHSRLIRELLLKRDLPEIRLPGRMADISLKDALGDIHRRLESLPAEIGEAARAMELFSERWHSSLTRCRDRIIDRIEQRTVTRRFLCSKYTFFIRGWVPRRESARLFEKVEATFGGRVIAEMDEKIDGCDAPVQIRNPAIVRPFEVFTRLLPLPAYGTVDPAPFFAFFFPIFFGLIIGDIGYGLVIFALAILLRRRSSPGSFWRSLSSVFALSSPFAIFFGVLFGEFFSTLGERFHLLHYIGRAIADEAGQVTYHPILYDRIDSMLTFLLLAIIIGTAHVILGFLLGIFTALRTRRYQRFFVTAGMLVALLTAIVLILSTIVDLAPAIIWTAASLFAFSLVGTTLLEGFVAPIEIVSALSNILSYARIMAIGLASVILGLVANHLGSLPDSIVAGILIAAVLHAVNIVLAVFSPTIHSMRLHFVEFFGKFYEPGGKPYQPFRKSGGM
jgi:V/A-type H+-transporting ATPase subunit I